MPPDARQQQICELLLHVLRRKPFRRPQQIYRIYLMGIGAILHLAMCFQVIAAHER